jgi:hypothetical protein
MVLGLVLTIILPANFDTKEWWVREIRNYIIELFDQTPVIGTWHKTSYYHVNSQTYPSTLDDRVPLNRVTFKDHSQSQVSDIDERSTSLQCSNYSYTLRPVSKQCQERHNLHPLNNPIIRIRHPLCKKTSAKGHELVSHSSSIDLPLRPNRPLSAAQISAMQKAVFPHR